MKDIYIDAAKKSILELRKLGVKVEAYEIDVGQLDQVEGAKEKIESDLGKVTILVNNAAILFSQDIETELPEKLLKMINVNIMSGIWTTRVFLKTMKEQKSGHIVTISSLAAITGIPYNINYTTTKFAVRGFMESLAIDLYHQGYGNLINTTVVYPAIISTNDEVLRMFDLICNVFSKRCRKNGRRCNQI